LCISAGDIPDIPENTTEGAAAMIRPSFANHSKRSTARAGLCLASLLGLALLADAAWAQRDALVLQRNLAELVSDAHVILLGRVTNVKAEPHPQYKGIQTVVITLQVAEVWKGQAGPTYTFRNYAGDPQDFKQKLGYGGGQDVLLMLTQPSNIGMSSPAGLEQGRFRVFSDAEGNRFIVNGVNNAGLFRNLQKTAPKLDAQLSGQAAQQVLTRNRPGPIAFGDFKTIVQALLSDNQ
jgi:hypothetical protein